MLHFFWFNYHRRENDRDVYEVSNLEIQKWGERMLEERFDVHSTSCVSQGRVTRNPSDILIGHPTWHMDYAKAEPSGRSERNWVRDNRLTQDAACHPNTYVLMPWVPHIPLEWEESMPWYEPQLDAAKLVFGIGGRIWYDETMKLDDGTAAGRARERLVRLDMCVNADALKPLKRVFNPAGSRKLLHVSNLGTYKGFDVLLRSTKDVAVPSIASPQLERTERGTIRIKQFGEEHVINNLGFVSHANEVEMRTIVDGHDFYIHTSSMDAQATTILEFGVRGLVPIVTPESGFECEDAIYLTRYADRNREIIRKALQMPDDELRARSERVRAHIRKVHSWRTFYDTIAHHIERTCEH
jgi:glycosyltransferase involved in cell wall biosynthesis